VAQESQAGGPIGHHAEQAHILPTMSFNRNHWQASVRRATVGKSAPVTFGFSLGWPWFWVAASVMTPSAVTLERLGHLRVSEAHMHRGASSGW
jgi:hypothetical protein